MDEIHTFETLKPVYRSRLRIYLGKKFYTSKRYVKWYLGGVTYAHSFERETLSHAVFSHQTPLYRELSNVQMWLQYNKVDNLSIAIKRIDGIVIKPGETFSYWRLIGKPTYGKGYKDGMMLYYGKYKAAVGGGLCQLSNLIYWMVLHTPLEVTERHRHSFDVFPDANRTQPFGSGATCVYNYRDLQIVNNTDESYQIRLRMDSQHLIGSVHSNRMPYFTYELYERNHEMTFTSWGRYIRHNSIARKTFNTLGEMLSDLTVCENHALMMYEPYLETPKDNSAREAEHD